MKNYKTILIRVPISNSIDLSDIEETTSGLEYNENSDRLELNRMLNDEEAHLSMDVENSFFGLSKLQSTIIAFKGMGYMSCEIIEILQISKRRYYTEYGNLRKVLKREK
jgi:hypothetical protein